MISDAGWDRAATFSQAQPTQWLDHELMRPAACPARGGVPAVDNRTMRPRGQKISSRFQETKPREHSVSRPNAFGLLHTENSQMSRAPNLVSVYDGQSYMGCILSRGRLGFEAFDKDERSIGLFADIKSAADALSENTKQEADNE
jgi:hypothetical protein